MDQKRIFRILKKQKILYIANGNSIHDVKWMSFFSTQPERYMCFLLCDALCVLNDQTKLTLAKLNIHLVEQISPLSIKHPLGSWRAIRQFKKMVLDIQPDVIHVLFATPNALWLNFTKKPSIITTRGSDILIVIPDLLEQKGVKKYYFSFLFRQFRKAFSNAEVVTGTSLNQIQKCKQLFKITDLSLVRTGVDVEKIDKLNNIDLIPESLSEKKFVLSPRFMAPIYNIELQLEAISRLDKEIIEQFKFVFIRGKQYDESYFQLQLKSLEKLKTKLNLNYLVIDYLNQEEMWMILKKSSLCIMTPISDGTPNSALEAMSAKCPLIISNLNYDIDLFENSCIKLKSFDAQELKETIELSLKSYNPLLISKGFETVLKLGNRAVEMKKIASIYAKII